MTYCLVAETSLSDCSRIGASDIYVMNTKDVQAERFFSLFTTLVRLGAGYTQTAVEEVSFDLIKLGIELCAVPKDIVPAHSK